MIIYVLDTRAGKSEPPERLKNRHLILAYVATHGLMT